MLNQSLVGRVVGFARKIADEFSYQTGIGWKYGPNEGYFDRLSRRLQRDGVFPNGTPYASFSEAWGNLDRAVREGISH